MGQVTGIVKIKINGQLIRSMEGAKLNTGGIERTDVVGFALYGHSEKVVPAEISCTIAHMADTDILALNQLTGAVVNFETDTGVVFVVADAFTTKPVELTGGKGEVTLEMKGEPAQQH
jgi:hypothetical protein